MGRRDTWAGLFLLGLGIFIIREASRLEYVYEHGPGPGFLPLWIGIALSVLSAALVVKSARLPRPQDADARSEWRKLVKPMIAWSALLAMVFFVDVLGFLLSFALVAAFLVYALDRQRLPVAMATSLGATLAFYLIFVYALGLRLPRGPWGF
jgi:putative tricarboxylic transport membrane protein